MRKAGGRVLKVVYRIGVEAVRRQETILPALGTLAASPSELRWRRTARAMVSSPEELKADS
jgi:hypothetical protein